jgi:hypothetical protein
MRPTARLVVLCLSASVALLAMTAAAAARPKPISGKLSKPGYTVIALAANGTITAATVHGDLTAQTVAFKRQ